MIHRLILRILMLYNRSIFISRYKFFVETINFVVQINRRSARIHGLKRFYLVVRATQT